MVGFYSLLFLAQTWPRIDQDRYLFVVSNQIHAVTGAEELQPMVATLLGPVQTIGSEYPDIHCRNIDIVRPSSDSDIHQQVIQLLAECQTTNTERLVAYRHKQRWIRTFESIRFPAANPKMVLRHQGVYLITGGLGGIGLSLATYLAETVQAKLILIGRSALPDAQAWDDWLNTHTEDDATAIKIRGLRKIQNQGSEILVLQADVSRREQMQIAIEQGQARFGIIHGVIHAAGVSKDGIIEIKTTTETALVLSPKVQGTLFLTQLLETQQLDFLIFCSSLSALMEIHGRVDYCSANAFLDAYAQALCTQGVNATSINWDGWQEVGMAVNMMNFKDGKKADLQVPQAIKPAEGVEALARILSHPMPQILLSTTDWQQRLQQQNHDLQLQKNEWLKKKDMTGSSQHNRPALTTEYVAPRNLIEQQITNIWQLLLGIEPIGIYDNFLELGGHSLLMTQLISSLHQTFSVKLPMQTLFESSTIAKLAEEIDHIQTIRQQLQTTTGQPNNKLEEIEL
jgi:NAD(P)-dependent dehydrogenase (short-subunit alcohol dehydrogenase family)/acyl carrier protein